jgi:uncharacterized protein
MTQQNGYQHGVPCWIDTWQPDADAAVDFYTQLFGWEAEDTMPEGVEGKHYMCRLDGRDVAAVASRPQASPDVTAWTTYVWVDDADETAAQVRAAGGSLIREPFDSLDGGRVAIVADPAGAALGVWELGEHRGAEVVNEPGAWAMSLLSTPDTEGAVAFYGAVFGWQTMTVGGGNEMWTLPGYGDHLEERTPGLREMVAQMGGPPGFEDVVASINPIPDDELDVPAHWSVTFGTDDADATAAKAAELGGKVVVPPFDAPWVRMTLIADPGGATVIASQFVAENRA